MRRPWSEEYAENVFCIIYTCTRSVPGDGIPGRKGWMARRSGGDSLKML
jgi:hypothetical protein